MYDLGASPLPEVVMHSSPTQSYEAPNGNVEMDGLGITHNQPPFGFKVEEMIEPTSSWTSVPSQSGSIDFQVTSSNWAQIYEQAGAVWSQETMGHAASNLSNMSAPLTGQSPQVSICHSRQLSSYSPLEQQFSPRPETSSYGHYQTHVHDMIGLPQYSVPPQTLLPSPPMSNASLTEFVPSPILVSSQPGSPDCYITAMMQLSSATNNVPPPTPSHSVLRYLSSSITSSPRQLPHHPIDRRSPLPIPDLAAQSSIASLQQKRDADLRSVERKRKRRPRSTERGRYICEVCGMSLARPYNLRNHMKTHEENRLKEHACAVEGCAQAFVRNKDMQRHVDAVHLKIKDKICSSCNRAFTRTDILRRHLELGCRMRPKAGGPKGMPQKNEIRDPAAVNSISTDLEPPNCPQVLPLDNRPLKRIVNPLFAEQQYLQQAEHLLQPVDTMATPASTPLPLPPKIEPVRIKKESKAIKREPIL